MSLIVERYRGGLKADIHVPAAPTGASVLLVHGGGFVLGSRRMPAMRFVAARLAAAGAIVCSVDYRLGLRLHGATDDVRAALDYWRTRAPELGAASDVSMIGLSAGGTLALRVAAREPVARVAACFGLYEVDHLPAIYPRLLFRTGDRSTWELIAHPTVPALLLHGSRDRLVPVAQAERLAARREALGLPTQLVVVPGARHGFLRGDSAAADAGARELVRFVG